MADKPADRLGSLSAGKVGGSVGAEPAKLGDRRKSTGEPSGSVANREAQEDEPQHLEATNVRKTKGATDK